MGYTFDQSLAIVFLAGIIFLIITLTPIREKRIALENNLEVDEIIHEGSKRAQIKAQEVLDGAIEVIKMYK